MKKTLEHYFFNKTDRTYIQLIRYTFAGGIAFLVDFSLLWFLTEIGQLHYLLSATLSFLIGLTVSYLLSTKWVFNEAKFTNKKVEFLLFGLIGIIGLGLNDLFLWILSGYYQLHYLMAKLIVVFLIYIWNFSARKYLLYKR